MEDTGVSTVARAAGFWRRFVAAFIDGIVISLVALIVRLLLGSLAESFVSLVLSIAYFTYFHGSTGQTPGNAALSIRVVDIETGEAGIGYGRAATRWLVSVVSGLVVFVGYLWMLWDDDRQTWHDKAARTLPVNV